MKRVDEILSPTMLDGRVALVTGGAGGIGRAITETLLSLGAELVICGRRPPEVVPHWGAREAIFHMCDVRDSDRVLELIGAISAQFGRLDIVVNNAGGSPLADAATASPRLSAKIIALNLTAPLHVATAAHGLLSASPEGGVIVNISSLSGTRPSPGTAAYGAAKAGLLSLTRTLAMEWGPFVRVNALVVGLVGMEGGDQHYGDAAARERIDAMLPLRRMASGEDVANAVAYLVSPLASYVSGTEIALHGGGERPIFLELAAS